VRFTTRSREPFFYCNLALFRNSEETHRLSATVPIGMIKGAVFNIIGDVEPSHHLFRWETLQRSWARRAHRGEYSRSAMQQSPKRASCTCADPARDHASALEEKDTEKCGPSHLRAARLLSPAEWEPASFLLDLAVGSMVAGGLPSLLVPASWMVLVCVYIKFIIIM